MPSERVFEYTDETLIARFKTEGRIDLDGLAALPCLFVEETSRGRSQVAHVGMIVRARAIGADIVLDYAYDLEILAVAQSILEEHATDLEMADFEFSRTHWAVKDLDLYRFLLKNAQPRRSQPRVFNLAEIERIEPGLVSVMMPFNSNFDSVFDTLRRTAEVLNLKCQRADDIWENQFVIQDVVSLIDRSNVVICDCTSGNPNVFYEIGIADTLGRHVILITQNESDIPFDLRHLRFVTYLNNAEGLNALATRLRDRLLSIRAESRFDD
jgi:hypothetical protein